MAMNCADNRLLTERLLTSSNQLIIAISAVIEVITLIWRVWAIPSSLRMIHPINTTGTRAIPPPLGTDPEWLDLMPGSSRILCFKSKGLANAAHNQVEPQAMLAAAINVVASTGISKRRSIRWYSRTDVGIGISI